MDPLIPLREKIDGLDREITGLLNRRLALVAEIGRHKHGTGGAIYVPEREDAVFRKVAGLNPGPLQPAALQAIYREIMSAALALEKPLRIAHLGPEAGDCHQAARNKFGASVGYHGFATLADLFTAVEKGEADHGVVPARHPSAGPGRDTPDLLAGSELKIVAQLSLVSAPALLSRTPLENIRRVLGGAETLASCGRWLRRQLPHATLVEVPDLAQAVRGARDEPGTAAVAGELAAEIHEVPVLARHLQDQPEPPLRFLVLGPKAAGPVGGGRDRSSYLLSLNDPAATEPGILLRLLRPLARQGLKILALESRPGGLRPGTRDFFLEVSGHHDDAANHAALVALQKISPRIKWLGSYPAAD